MKHWNGRFLLATLAASLVMLASQPGSSASHAPVVSPPPILFVNQFFASCFQQNTDMNWRSIIDFIIFHSSWFDNSNVGACSANPDVVQEAQCWKDAFALLISRRSPYLKVARYCVNAFVIATRPDAAGLLPRETLGRRRDHISAKLNRRDCPSVDPYTLASDVINMSDPLPQFDHTLQDFESVANFVDRAALCLTPSCDQCNTTYLSRKYPTSELRCKDCWPTRLAGMIKESSPLKIVVTQVAVNLGNNAPVPPLHPSFNAFITYCLQQNPLLDSSKNWSSLVDFTILHTSWFENSNRASCRPGNPDLKQETQCWLEAYGHLMVSSPLLEAARECVVELANQAQQASGITGDIIGMLEEPFTYDGGESLNSPRCPAVDPDAFTAEFLRLVDEASAGGALLPTDHTLEDFRFVVEQVMTNYMCLKETCDQCNVSYQRPRGGQQRGSSNIRDRRREISCCRCWPTRLAGMIKSSSPLKVLATNAALAFATN